MCRDNMGHLRVTIGHLRGHPRVTIGHLRVTLGHLTPWGNYRQFFSISKQKANTTELHPKVRQTCLCYFFIKLNETKSNRCN